MSGGTDLPKRVGGTSIKGRLILGIGGVLGVAVVILAVWIDRDSEDFDKGVFDYGFSGEV
jgi:hypothetical protein